MKYSTLEKILLVVGTGVVLITGALALLQAQPDIKEIIGQFLIIPVLLGALHYGRRGGMISFLAASLVYILIYLPTTLTLGYSSTLPLFAIRALTYGLIGIGGGELAHHIKYLFARFEHADFIDTLTGLYTKERFAEIVISNIKQFNRYQAAFSIITTDINSKALSSLKRQDQQIKKVGEVIKGNVRAVDEVARIDATTFGLLLPYTPVSNTKKVTQRLERMITNLLPKPEKPQTIDTLVQFETIGYPEDKQKIEKLIEELKAH